nr:hypothetical protein [Microbacterium bovistercoris]
MGLFAPRPQEPFDWAGLPSEPLRPRSESEQLDDLPVDPFAISPGVVGSSITIALGTETGQDGPSDEPAADADADDAEN